MDFENLNTWCKWLEKNFSPDIMIPTLPVIIRLDGNGFGKYTKNLNKPFDDGFADLMIDTTKFLVKETGAVVGFCQSDEISLILYSDNRRSSLYNDGKKQKILSKLTAKCVNHFNKRRVDFLPNHDKTAVFDCRIYQTPTLEDAVAQLIWRENDASKNSISMLAQSMFSHGSMEGLNGSQLQDRMMIEKGVNWNNLQVKFKRGSYIKRITKSIPFSAKEISKLNPKHKAHSNPDLCIERTVVEVVEYPVMNKIENRVDVIFNDASVKLKSE